MGQQSTIARVLVWVDSFGEELNINYGLAPNPFGFSFIAPTMSVQQKNHLSLLLDDLTDTEEIQLREVLYE